MLTLAFDNTLVAGLDWALRWANPLGGNRVVALNSLIAGGLITWSAPQTVSVFDNADGYTYMGYQVAATPEPTWLGLGSLLAGMTYFWRRRRVALGIDFDPGSSMLSGSRHALRGDSKRTEEGSKTLLCNASPVTP